MTFEDIKNSKYIEFQNYNQFYGRVVLMKQDIKLLEECDNRVTYELSVTNSKRIPFKLILKHSKNCTDDKWYCSLPNEKNLYRLRCATNKVADFIKQGDTMIIQLPDTPYPIRVRVAQYIEKYNHIICVYNGERRNLKTVLDRWGNFIVGIYTYDEYRMNNA